MLHPGNFVAVCHVTAYIFLQGIPTVFATPVLHNQQHTSTCPSMKATVRVTVRILKPDANAISNAKRTRMNAKLTRSVAEYEAADSPTCFATCPLAEGIMLTFI